ncbi:MAG TPA: chorismate mutase [bacterium]|nr:chorismate mutase [bacterium]
MAVQGVFLGGEGKMAGGDMAAQAARTPAQSGADPLAELRTQIDSIDAQVLALLNQRAESAVAIARIKRAQHQPLRSPEREEALLQRLATLNAGPLPNSAVRSIYETIVRHTRELQERLAAAL